MEVGTLKYIWKIKNFSNLQTDEELYSDVFSLGPYKWRLCADNDETGQGALSIYLIVADWETLPSGWSRNAKFSLTLIDQIDKKFSITKSKNEVREFNAEKDYSGFYPFVYHEDFHNPKRGYLVDDTCIIEADVTMYGNVSAESHGTGKEADEEDMDAFFVDMQSVISTKKVLSSNEEAKEALAIIDEALDMVPSGLNNPGRISQLRNAFDVLSSLDGCSVLTLEQKGILISLKEKFMDLPRRAANAVKDIKLFTEKELVKTTLDRKLKRCLVEFEKAKAETIQNKQNIATLLAQVGEMEKKKENSSSKKKEMFKLSKELKVELDVLVKNWPEYEANMKAAKKEEKVIATEWGKMKQLFSSLKKPVFSSLKPSKQISKEDEATKNLTI